jgi:altronate dehydratase
LETIVFRKKTTMEKVVGTLTTLKKAMLEKATTQKKEAQKMETMMVNLKTQGSVHEEVT